MNFEEIVTVLKDISYKGDKDFFTVTPVVYGEEMGFDITVRLPINDKTTGEETTIYTHYTYGPREIKALTYSNIVRRVKSMFMYLETHEVEEQLLYQGMRVFEPHTKDLYGPLVSDEKVQHETKMSALKSEIIKKLKGKK